MAQKRFAAESERAAAKPLQNSAPDFTLDDLDGRQVTLSDFKGKPILLTFWGVG